MQFQDPRCPEGYEYVHSQYIRGVYVKPFCRKKGDKRRNNNPDKVKKVNQ